MRVPWTARAKENGELLLNGYRISVLQTETELKHYCLEDGYTTMRMYLMPLHYTFTNDEDGKFYVMCILA